MRFSSDPAEFVGKRALGGKFWLRVMTELKNRGVADILIGVDDPLINRLGSHKNSDTPVRHRV